VVGGFPPRQGTVVVGVDEASDRHDRHHVGAGGGECMGGRKGPGPGRVDVVEEEDAWAGAAGGSGSETAWVGLEVVERRLAPAQ
jgi:hypothetical protein